MMASRVLNYPVILSACAFLLLTCSKYSQYPEDVASALTSSGDNAKELVKVLDHYSAPEDSLKLRAAYYLIGNMGEHCYVTYSLIDTAGSDVDFNCLAYPNYDSLQVAVRSIEDSVGELDYKSKDKLMDLETIKADFLINQIDFAFRAWHEKPWAKRLSYDNFLAYVLPYRGSNEPLEPWRKTFWDKYAGIQSEMKDSTDPIEAACLINDDIKSWFGFDPRYYYHPTDQGISEMMAGHLGRCEDMTNVTIYALRANGIAVTSDYTPYWANATGNHAWNAIVTPAGKVIPFMGAEANPGSYSLGNALAKVYRKTYATQPDNLIFQERKQESVPRWLAGRSYVDVTADYVDACNVTVTFDKKVPDSVDVAYLCVFNSGSWQAIHWGRIQDNKATFTDMGTGIAYLPALYENEELVPFAPPFILASDCTRQPLVAAEQETESLRLTSTTKRTQAVATDGVAQTSLTPGKMYELFYWQDGWHSDGSAAATNQPLVFNEVPSGGLYRLVAEHSDREERIFTYSDGQQIWW
jgi:hypothetical protein